MKKAHQRETHDVPAERAAFGREKEADAGVHYREEHERGVASPLPRPVLLEHLWRHGHAIHGEVGSKASQMKRPSSA